MKTIYVTSDFVGFHCWPEAPEQVAFLRNLHRHKFGVRVEVLVTHSDRQVEFFMLKRDVLEVLQKGLMPKLREERGLSCEMMAEYLFNSLTTAKYVVVSVSVSEDGENGATYYAEPPTPKKDNG